MSSAIRDKGYREKMRAAARHLRCEPNERAIVAECRRQADCRCDAIDPMLTPVERLAVLADSASVLFEIARTNEELDEMAARYARLGELGFLARRERFDGELLAAILRRNSPAQGERTFVALVDARGDKGAREFFSQAHEVAHPVLEPQLAFNFRDETKVRDAWEKLVDQVGAEMVFSGTSWANAIGLALQNSPGLTVAAVADLRSKMASTASLTTIALAAADQANRPILVAWAGCEGSKRDPTPILRLLRPAPNAVAVADGITHIHRKRRVPDSSPIARSYRSRSDEVGFEDLGDWRDSTGVALPTQRVWTAARAMGERVFAIMDFAADS